MPDGQRRALAGGDHQVVLAVEEEAEREGPVQAGQRLARGLDRRTGPGPCAAGQAGRPFRCRSRIPGCSPRLPVRSRRSRKFSMMPLWTTATGPALCGWALVTVAAPWVAQRVWPMPGLARERLVHQQVRQVDQLAHGAAAVQPARCSPWRCRRCHSRDIPAASAPRPEAGPPRDCPEHRQCRTFSVFPFAALMARSRSISFGRKAGLVDLPRAADGERLGRHVAR